ncbi:MAG: glycosyltransferase family 39 protein [Gaiellaceae bacterium]
MSNEQTVVTVPAATADPHSSVADSSAWRLLLVGEMAIAAALSFLALGRRSFWLDESVSVTGARLDWSGFLHWIHASEGNMSLYHLLLFGWARVVGSSEVAARSLSAVAGVASVAVLFLLAKRLAGMRVALLAGLLMAVNPLYVRYAQEARGYSLCLLLVTLASYLFVRALDRPSWANWIAYTLVAGLSAYAHVFALLVPASHAVSLLFVDRRALPRRKLAISAGLLLLSQAPLAYLLAASGQSSAVGWVASNNAVGRLFVEIHARKPLAGAVLILGAVFLLFVYRPLARRFGSPTHATSTWSRLFVMSWLLVPPVLVAGFAVVHEPLFLARYFIVCLPPAVFLLALILDRIRRPELVTAATLALVLLSLVPVVRWYSSGQVENWRGAARSVARATKPGDGVLFFSSFVRVPFALYLNESGMGGRAPVPINPSGNWGSHTSVYGTTTPISAAYLRRHALHFPRIWLVLSHYSPGQSDYDSARAWLADAGYRERRSESFAGVAVVLYSRRN